VNLPPLSLYVHLPWCVQKCPYCDFNSHAARGDVPAARYVDALLADIDREAARAGNRPVESIYLGGGTPSLFPPREIGRLLEGIDERLELNTGAEITMEANPGTVECGAPAGYRAAGVNRVSIGAQSFDDLSLQRLGRIHSADDIRHSVEAFVAASFDNFNLDLMHGLPRQTPDMAVSDLRAALSLGPAHLSWYQLTLEPNTVFHARPPTGLPDDDTAWAIQDAGEAVLGDAGFERYEVSAWARAGRVCRHNLNYWRFGDYLAVGAGAHGKITDGEAVLRYRKAAHPLQYLQMMEAGEHGAMADVPGEADLVFEFMLNALRLVDGFNISLFEERTGLARDTLEELAADAFSRGLLEQSAEGTWRPTALGMRFLDDLQADFLPAP
jgi:putative oxygen-independent coproporphyrinogen III oxidase